MRQRTEAVGLAAGKLPGLPHPLLTSHIFPANCSTYLFITESFLYILINIFNLQSFINILNMIFVIIKAFFAKMKTNKYLVSLTFLHFLSVLGPGGERRRLVPGRAGSGRGTMETQARRRAGAGTGAELTNRMAGGGASLIGRTIPMWSPSGLGRRAGAAGAGRILT